MLLPYFALGISLISSAQGCNQSLKDKASDPPVKATDAQKSALCLEHWVDASSAGLGCLLFNNTSKLSWEDASNYCQDDEDAKLLEISNSLQMDFVRSELALIYDYDT